MAKLKNSQKYGTIRLNQRDKSEVVEVKERLSVVLVFADGRYTERIMQAV